MAKGLGHHLHREKLRELELFNVEKRRFRGHLINMYKYLEGRCNGDGARLFSMMPSMDKSRWVQTETQHVPYEHQEKCFYCEGD